jgi:hypothetical protein
LTLPKTVYTLPNGYVRLLMPSVRLHVRQRVWIETALDAPLRPWVVVQITALVVTAGPRGETMLAIDLRPDDPPSLDTP